MLATAIAVALRHALARGHDLVGICAVGRFLANGDAEIGAVRIFAVVDLDAIELIRGAALVTPRMLGV